MSDQAVLDLVTLTPESAEPKAAELLNRAKERLGFVPNMYANMAQLPELLETYMSGYEGFRSGAGFTPPEQEVVFLAISLENGCGYCVAAHSMIAEKVSKLPADSLAALRDGRALPDPKLDALASFTRRMVRSRGMPSRADVQAFLEAGFEHKHVFGIILAMGVKTFSNYTNHVAGTEVDEAFAGHKLAA